MRKYLYMENYANTLIIIQVSAIFLPWGVFLYNRTYYCMIFYFFLGKKSSTLSFNLLKIFNRIEDGGIL